VVGHGRSLGRLYESSEWDTRAWILESVHGQSVDDWLWTMEQEPRQPEQGRKVARM
jgi:hypothetical protein